MEWPLCPQAACLWWISKTCPVPLLAVGDCSPGASHQDCTLWFRWAGAKGQARHAFAGAGAGWLTLEEAVETEPEMQHVQRSSWPRGSPGQLSAISGTHFYWDAVSPGRLGMVRRPPSLRIACAQERGGRSQAFLPRATWCL